MCVYWEIGFWECEENEIIKREMIPQKVFVFVMLKMNNNVSDIIKPNTNKENKDSMVWQLTLGGINWKKGVCVCSGWVQVYGVNS